MLLKIMFCIYRSSDGISISIRSIRKSVICQHQNISNMCYTLKLPDHTLKLDDQNLRINIYTLTMIKDLYQVINTQKRHYPVKAEHSEALSQVKARTL